MMYVAGVKQSQVMFPFGLLTFQFSVNCSSASPEMPTGAALRPGFRKLHTDQHMGFIFSGLVEFQQNIRYFCRVGRASRGIRPKNGMPDLRGLAPVLPLEAVDQRGARLSRRPSLVHKVKDL